MILAFFRQEHGESSASQVWEEDASLVFYLKDTLSFSVLGTTYIPPARNKSWSHQRAYCPAKPSSAGQIRLFPSSILVPWDLHQGMDQRRELVYSSIACCIHFLPYILVHQRIWNNSCGKKVWNISKLSTQLRTYLGETEGNQAWTSRCSAAGDLTRGLGHLVIQILVNYWNRWHFFGWCIILLNLEKHPRRQVYQSCLQHVNSCLLLKQKNKTCVRGIFLPLVFGVRSCNVSYWSSALREEGNILSQPLKVALHIAHTRELLVKKAEGLCHGVQEEQRSVLQQT